MTSSLNDWFKHDLLNLPYLASEHGKHVDDLIVYVHWLMLVLFVGWLAYFFCALVRFRKSKNPKADYVGVKSHASNWIEGGVALVEGILLIGLAVPLWAKVVNNPPNASEAILIRVIGKQFNWSGHYAGPDGVMGRQDPKLSSSTDPFGIDRKGDTNAVDDVVILNNFVVPVSRPVIVLVGSLDVIHSFAIRSMRVCQDATPGVPVPTWFTPTKTGKYLITCAQLCGNGHYSMRGTIQVVSQTDFAKWLAEQSAKAKGAESYE
jgi:cytochrome c oxidase subunit 2